MSFSFGRGEPVLDGVDLAVGEGEVVAVVGASGSGKSTIVDLLSRQLDPDAGRILLGGRDLRALRLADVRAAVVPVEQEPFLFNTTIAENIRYGRPDASDAEVAAAARAVGLDAFLATLPDGLETQVGEQGRELSAGQRQRVAVARAFLADPRVLVLDEPTSALDPASERALMEGYQAVMRGRTTILVSHRLALARRADRVVVLERGRIVEEGDGCGVAGAARHLRPVVRGGGGLAAWAAQMAAIIGSNSFCPTLYRPPMPRGDSPPSRPSPRWIGWATTARTPPPEPEAEEIPPGASPW